MTQDQVSAEAREAAELGRQAGESAASWAFDGNTSIDTYRETIQGIEDCDPLVLDRFRVPNLSGEWADEVSSQDLTRELGIADEDAEHADEVCSAWEDAASEAYWAAVESTAREHVLEARRATLTGAGLRVVYAPRDPDRSTVWCSDVSELDSAHGSELEAYVMLGSIGRGEDTAGQSTTVDRSNFRSLQRDYPDVFTPTAYANVDSLGAFLADIPDEVADILAKLATDYPLYDEEDHSELEDEEITASWEQYVSADFPRELPEDVSDEWDNMTEDAQREHFWEAVQATESYPEHSGLDVCWRYGPIAEHVATVLRVRSLRAASAVIRRESWRGASLSVAVADLLAHAAERLEAHPDATGGMTQASLRVARVLLGQTSE